MTSDTWAEEDVQPEDANEEAKKEEEASQQLSGAIKCCRPAAWRPPLSESERRWGCENILRNLARVLKGQWKEEQIFITRRTQNSIFLEREEEEFHKETRLHFFEIAGWFEEVVKWKVKETVCKSLIIRGWEDGGGGNDEVVKYKKTQATRTENNTQTWSEIQPHTAQM